MRVPAETAQAAQKWATDLQSRHGFGEMADKARELGVAAETLEHFVHLFSPSVGGLDRTLGWELSDDPSNSRAADRAL